MRICACVVAAASAAFAQSGGAVSGRVVDSMSAQPVAGAEVTLHGDEAFGGGPTQTYVLETGSDGRFSVAGVAPGVYDPRPKKMGYTARDFPAFTVENGKAVANIEMRLIPDGAIDGRVLDSDGDPMRCMSVQALQYRFARGRRQLVDILTAQTDDHGEYRLFHLPPGRYYLQATYWRGASFERRFNGGSFVCRSNWTWGPTFYPATGDVARAEEVTVAPGAELDGLDIRFASHQVYSISLNALNAGDRSVGFSLRSRPDGTEVRYTLTIDRDRFQLKRVPAGSYTLTALAKSGARKLENCLYAKLPVDVKDDDQDVSLTFANCIPITGKVRIEGSDDFEHSMTARFQTLDDGEDAVVNVKADGALEPTGLAQGRYRLSVSSRAGVYLKAAWVGDQELPGKVIDVTNPVDPLTLSVEGKTGKIAGTVVDEAGKPVYNAEVTISRDGDDDWDDRFYMARTKTDGKFELSGIVSGEYRAYAWVGARLDEPQDPEFRKPFEERGVMVKVDGKSAGSVMLKAIEVRER
jgi:hypothetical protein